MTTVIDPAVLDVLAAPKVVDAVERLITARRRGLAVVREPGRAVGDAERDRAQRRFLAGNEAREALDTLKAAIDRSVDDLVRQEANQ